MAEERPRILKPKLRSYVRNLTDLYDLRVPWWEAVECVRKVVILGVAVLLGQGSLAQLSVMLLVTLSFAIFYVEVAEVEGTRAAPMRP